MPIKHLVFFYMLLLSILASTLLGKVLMCLVGWHMSALSLFFSNRRLKFLIKWPAKNTHSQHKAKVRCICVSVWSMSGVCVWVWMWVVPLGTCRLYMCVYGCEWCVCMEWGIWEWRVYGCVWVCMECVVYVSGVCVWSVWCMWVVCEWCVSVCMECVVCEVCDCVCRVCVVYCE